MKTSAKQKLSVALGAAILGLGVVVGLAGPAPAAPGIAGALMTHAGDAGQVEKVTYGWHRHCYWRYGYRHCHWGPPPLARPHHGGYRHWGYRDWRYGHLGSRSPSPF